MLFLEDHHSPLSAPLFLQSFFSRAVHWRTGSGLELSTWGARGARLPNHGLQLSGLWLQAISAQTRHKVFPAFFRCTLWIYLGLPLPGGGSLATRGCHDCLMVVNHRRLTLAEFLRGFCATTHQDQPRHPCSTPWGRRRLDSRAVTFGPKLLSRHNPELRGSM